MKYLLTSFLSLCGLILGSGVLAHAAAIEPVALANTLAPGDDQTSWNVNLGFTVNLNGTSYASAAVNTNGNLSFGDGGFGQGTPASLSSTNRLLIAPFWADVDTRGGGTIQYGSATVAGRSAFVATYTNVGFYPANNSKTNSFQLILFSRPDTGAGNFDVEFNYDRIQWESGNDSGGVNGLGGTSALAGLASTQLIGSLTPGAFLDGGPNSLVANSLNARGGVNGRYDFTVRNGAVINPIPEPASYGLLLLGVGCALAAIRKHRLRS